MDLNDAINDVVNQPEHRAFLREVQALMVEAAILNDRGVGNAKVANKLRKLAGKNGGET